MAGLSAARRAAEAVLFVIVDDSLTDPVARAKIDKI